jgi:hypothetical protein
MSGSTLFLSEQPSRLTFISIPERDQEAEMLRQSRFTITTGAAFAALSASAAGPGMQSAKPVPETLKAPADQVLAFELQATGVQIYECQVRKEDPAQFEWIFKAPEADLFDASGRLVGKHYGGPTWESPDGSKVVGEVKAKDTSLSSSSIPWLLLGAKTTSGQGLFSPVKSIQRLNTVGGAAPASASRAQAGQVARVPYTATYAFYVGKP